MSTMSINLDTTLQKRSELKAQELNLEPTKQIIKAIEDFIYFDRINKIRDTLNDLVKKQGYQSEADIFNEIS